MRPPCPPPLRLRLRGRRWRRADGTGPRGPSCRGRSPTWPSSGRSRAAMSGIGSARRGASVSAAGGAASDAAAGRLSGGIADAGQLCGQAVARFRAARHAPVLLSEDVGAAASGCSTGSSARCRRRAETKPRGPVRPRSDRRPPWALAALPRRAPEGQRRGLLGGSCVGVGRSRRRRAIIARDPRRPARHGREARRTRRCAIGFVGGQGFGVRAGLRAFPRVGATGADGVSVVSGGRAAGSTARAGVALRSSGASRALPPRTAQGAWGSSRSRAGSGRL